MVGYWAKLTTCLMMHRLLTRSVLDYSCFIYGNGSKNLLKKLDKMQYEAIRICLGVMRSSPTNAFYNIRRECLANSYLWRKLNCVWEDIPKQMNVLIYHITTNTCWRKKDVPIFVKVALQLRNEEENIIKNSKLPMFTPQRYINFPNIRLKKSCIYEYFKWKWKK